MKPEYFFFCLHVDGPITGRANKRGGGGGWGGGGALIGRRGHKGIVSCDSIRKNETLASQHLAYLSHDKHIITIITALDASRHNAVIFSLQAALSLAPALGPVAPPCLSSFCFCCPLPGRCWSPYCSLSLWPAILALDRGQTREICQKQEKYFKGKVVIFTVQSLILCQYAVGLPTYLELY